MIPPTKDRGGRRAWPRHGWLGLGLIALFWYLNWTLTGPRTHWGFFPLWLGYCLTVDAWVAFRKGNSLFRRNPKAYVFLFFLSAPAWWLFELYNLRTQNWFYDGRELFTNLEYFLLASLSFSTVMPAVFGTAELVSTFPWFRSLSPGRPTQISARTRWFLFLVGLIMLGLLIQWPRYFFAFVWGSAIFLVEPINARLGCRHLFACLAGRNWRPILSLATGCLVCGFFWELWNFYSYPKWIYRVPFVGFWKVFEMPILGYLGYLTFSFELFAIYELIAGRREKRSASGPWMLPGLFGARDS